MEYEKCFQPLQRLGASRHIIDAEGINLGIAVDTLVGAGVIVGQTTLFEGDTIYFLNPEKPNPALKLNSEWNVPIYATPEERLRRPTVLKNGVTELIV